MSTDLHEIHRHIFGFCDGYDTAITFECSGSGFIYNIHEGESSFCRFLEDNYFIWEDKFYDDIAELLRKLYRLRDEDADKFDSFVETLRVLEE